MCAWHTLRHPLSPGSRRPGASPWVQAPRGRRGAPKSLTRGGGGGHPHRGREFPPHEVLGTTAWRATSVIITRTHSPAHSRGLGFASAEASWRWALPGARSRPACPTSRPPSGGKSLLLRDPCPRTPATASPCGTQRLGAVSCPFLRLQGHHPVAPGRPAWSRLPAGHLCPGSRRWWWSQWLPEVSPQPQLGFSDPWERALPRSPGREPARPQQDCRPGRPSQL